MRLTYPTTLVLQALLHGHHHGFDIMDATGLPSGTVYPILRRLDAEGLRPVALGEGRRRAPRAAPAAPLLRAHAAGRQHRHRSRVALPRAAGRRRP